jgi:hypothetical protein
MLIKVSELRGAALHWTVAKCEGFTKHAAASLVIMEAYSPSTNWAQGGPILDREEITIDYRDNETLAHKWSDELNDFIKAHAGKKQGLLAAMRCYVASKIGDTIEIPNELLD